MSEADRVLEVNARFYAAMRMGDLAEMDALWSRARSVACTHPTGPMLTGRDEVMESWRLILVEGMPPPVHEAGASAVVTGTTAMVLCEEHLGGTVLMASNAFALEDGEWRMLNHQAARIPRTVG